MRSRCSARHPSGPRRRAAGFPTRRNAGRRGAGRSMIAASSAMITIDDSRDDERHEHVAHRCVEARGDDELRQRECGDGDGDGPALRTDPVGRCEDQPQQDERRPRRHVPAQRDGILDVAAMREIARVSVPEHDREQCAEHERGDQAAFEDQRAVRAVREVRIPAEEARGQTGTYDGDDGRPTGRLDDLQSPGTRGFSIREIHGKSSWRAYDGVPA